jgi:hypothetical protein
MRGSNRPAVEYLPVEGWMRGRDVDLSTSEVGGGNDHACGR